MLRLLELCIVALFRIEVAAWHGANQAPPRPQRINPLRVQKDKHQNEGNKNEDVKPTNTGDIPCECRLVEASCSFWWYLIEVVACRDDAGTFLTTCLSTCCSNNQGQDDSKRNVHDKDSDDDLRCLELASQEYWRAREGSGNFSEKVEEDIKTVYEGTVRRAMNQAWFDRLQKRHSHSSKVLNDTKWYEYQRYFRWSQWHYEKEFQMVVSQFQQPKALQRSMNNRDENENESVRWFRSHVYLFEKVPLVLKLRSKQVTSDLVDLLVGSTSVDAPNKQILEIHRMELHHVAHSMEYWRLISTLIEKLPHLSGIGFYHSTLSSTEIGKISMAMKMRRKDQTGLKKILFVSTCIASTDSFQALEKLLRSPSRPWHEVLVKDCMDEGLIVQVAAKAKELKALRCIHNHVSSVEASLSHWTDLTHLEYLDLSHNALRKPDVLSMVSCLNKWKLRYLNLSKNEIKNDAILALALAISSAFCMELEELHLNACGMEYSGAVAVLKAFLHPRRIQLHTLDMGHNYLTDAIGVHLGLFLSENATVKVLRMNYVYLSSSGCVPMLQEALATNTTLLEVDFGANRLKDDGCRSLAQAFAKRMQIQSYDCIDLSANLISNVGLVSLLTSFKESLSIGESTRYTHNWPIYQLNLTDNFFRNCEESIAALRRFIMIVSISVLGNIPKPTSVYDDEV